MKKTIFLLAIAAILLSCTKTLDVAQQAPPKPKKEIRNTFNEWLLANCKARAIGTDGVIVFDAIEMKMNDTTVVNRGLWYYDPNPRPDLIFPSIYQYPFATSGTRRVIDLGTHYDWCPTTDNTKAFATVTVIAGSKQIVWENCPILVQDPKNTPVNWIGGKAPKTIKIVLSSKQ